MLDESSPTDTAPEETADSAPPRRRRAAKRPAGPPPSDATAAPDAASAAAAVPADAPTGAPADAPAEAPADAPAAPPAKKAAKRAPRKKAATAPAATMEPTPEAAAADTSRPEAARPEETGAPGEIPARKTTKRAPRKKAAAAAADTAPDLSPEPVPEPADQATPATAGAPTLGALFSGQEETPAPTRRRRATKQAAAPTTPEAPDAAAEVEGEAPVAVAPMFQAPDPSAAPVRRRTRKAVTSPEPTPEPEAAGDEETAEAATDGLVDGADAAEPVDAGDAEIEDDEDAEAEEGADSPSRRRRRRGGRRRRRGSSGGAGADSEGDADAEANTDGGRTSGSADSADASEAKEPDEDAGDSDESTEGGATRRRRRRRRRGEGVDVSPDDPANTVVRVREPRSSDDEITSIAGSTRLEAKKQRRREGRDAGRRRAPIVSESEFLARRESVKREMIIRQRDDLAQIAVLEDGVLVEHYVARESQTSLIGNVYLGRVQNVLPSMEAAFVDIGKGRNAVLYAGEVDWKALGVEGRPRKVEEVLKPGQTILVQVTKDPVGHKGARLTGQISLPGRYVVYVPGGQSSGISRKLSDTERSRLKALLKQILPDEAGVIIRTAAENATEEQLTRDVGALTARWDDIAKKSQAGGSAPQLLYGEPDLMIKVVRDLFNEDFVSLVVQGDDAWDMIQGYVAHVAPDLGDRLSRWGDSSGDHRDVFAAHRVDEQIAKGLDRKVWLPSGGSLVIDRTEAMTVVDVNTGKFTGSGGNLEETVTKNNLEAAEEIVRQLRLRDIGGIIVVDFIDMVLENNRDLVLRRMVECLGRDRTRHQVAEVTSLGLVQMTRKKIGTGLLEAFSETCEHCHGRGLLVHAEPVEARRGAGDDSGNGVAGNGGSAGAGGNGSGRDGEGGRRGRRGGRGRSGRSDEPEHLPPALPGPPPPANLRRSEPVPEPAEAEAVAAAAPDGADETPAAAPELEAIVAPATFPEFEVVADASEPATEHAAEPAAPGDPTAEAAPEPAARTRRTRQRASRPAAAPQPAAEPAAESPAVEPAAEPAAESASASAPLPAPTPAVAATLEPSEPPSAPAADPEPAAPPKRTRRRASRPAAAPTPAPDTA